MAGTDSAEKKGIDGLPPTTVAVYSLVLQSLVYALTHWHGS
jgi:hypothetical protein